MGKADEIIELKLMLIQKNEYIPLATKMMFESYAMLAHRLLRLNKICMHFIKKLKSIDLCCVLFMKISLS